MGKDNFMGAEMYQHEPLVEACIYKSTSQVSQEFFPGLLLFRGI